jgi:hypothetical protein
MGGVKQLFWVLSAFVAVAAGVEGAALLRPGPVEVSARALVAAVERVERLRKPTEPLVYSPLFSPRVVPALVEIGGTVEVPSARRAPVFWIVDFRDEPLRVEGRQTRQVELPEPLVLRRIEREGSGEAPAAFDLVRDLRAGLFRVEARGGRVVSQCDAPRPAGGFACPGQPGWVHAARVSHIIEGDSRRCVWAHPIAGKELVIEIPAIPVPPGHELELTFGAALSDSAVRQAPNGAPIQHRIRQASRTRSVLTVPNRKGWREQTVRLQGGLPIVWTITTGADGARHQCVDGLVRIVPAPSKTDGEKPKERVLP